MKFFFILSMFIISICGCLYVPQDYTPTQELVTDNAPKYAVTYSIEYRKDGDLGEGCASLKKYQTWIEKMLLDTGSFSEVTYRDFSIKSNYHLHFMVHYSSLPYDESSSRGAAAGVTMAIIPVWIDLHLDLSAVTYLNQKIIAAPSTTETLRCYIWLPFLPAGIVWNPWLAWTRQEKKCCRYLINEVRSATEATIK